MGRRRPQVDNPELKEVALPAGKAGIPEQYNLSVAQIKALEILLGGGTKTEAAKEAGVTRTTLYAWLENDEQFSSAYNEALQSAFRQATELRKAAITCAIENLMSMAGNEKLLAKYRVEACSALLKYGPEPVAGDNEGGLSIYLPQKGSIEIEYPEDEEDA